VSAKLSYRIAAALFVLFAVGHTFGFLSFKPPTAEAAAVRESMDRVQFMGGHSYGGFYVGFGLYIGAYLLFSAFLAWGLGNLAGKAPQAVGPVAWSFFGLQLAGAALSANYIGAPPGVFSGLTAICLGWGAWRTGMESTGERVASRVRINGEPSPHTTAR
jgi:hypothetical protein